MERRSFFKIFALPAFLGLSRVVKTPDPFMVSPNQTDTEYMQDMRECYRMLAQKIKSFKQNYGHNMTRSQQSALSSMFVETRKTIGACQRYFDHDEA